MLPTASNSEAAAGESADGAEERVPSRYWMYVTFALLGAGIMAYAQTWAFTDDEGFHLLAAQLIRGGMRPYLDFCFPQTPFNAYWNALWMSVFGESWRTAHALSALETWGAVVLAAQFVYAHLPERSWRVAGAIAAALIIGFNTNLVEFGPLGQAYGICLFCTVGAFCLAVKAVDHRAGWLAAAAGALAGVATASSLLSAMVAPVLLAWIWWNDRAGNRWIKMAAFAAGCAVPFWPLLELFAQSPRVVWFNVAQYHLHFRVVYWPDPLSHDLETLTAWSGEPQSLLLGLLAVFGIIYIARRSAWSVERRAEFYLCGWLTLGIAAELAFAHPTFPRYFCLLAPFLGILAVPGLYAIGSRVLAPERPFWPVLIISIIFAGVLARTLYGDRELSTWPEYEDMARKLREVTPPGKQVFAEEGIYFVSKRRPPPGMEFGYSHKLKLSAGELSALHITPEAALQQQLREGAFASAATCDDDTVNTYALEKTFRQKADLHDCSVFWDWKSSVPEKKVYGLIKPPVVHQHQASAQQ
jgi:hypothetical protein